MEHTYFIEPVQINTDQKEKTLTAIFNFSVYTGANLVGKGNCILTFSRVLGKISYNITMLTNDHVILCANGTELSCKFFLFATELDVENSSTELLRTCNDPTLRAALISCYKRLFNFLP